MVSVSGCGVPLRSQQPSEQCEYEEQEDHGGEHASGQIGCFVLGPRGGGDQAGNKDGQIGGCEHAEGSSRSGAVLDV